MKALLVALCLALPAGAQEMDRESAKAQTEKEKAHETRLGQWWGQRDPPFGFGGGRNIITDFYPLAPKGLTREQVLTCLVDTIAVVVVTGAKPVLSQGENFVFTEYEADVADAIKGRLADGQRASLVQIGGALRLGTETLSFNINSSPPLLVGHTYLAFLDYLPQTDDYSPRAMFEMQPGGVLRELYDGAGPMSVRRSSEAMASVRAWVCAK
jgi:hypothetical protein